MRSQRDDDDDDDQVRDGETVRRPMFLMDSVDAEWALHRPGYRMTDAKVEDARSAARQEMIDRMTNAWRHPVDARPAPRPKPDDPAGDPEEDDPQKRRDQAYRNFVAAQSEAWKHPFGVQPPQSALVGAGSSGTLAAVESGDPATRIRQAEAEAARSWRASGGR